MRSIGFILFLICFHFQLTAQDNFTKSQVQDLVMSNIPSPAQNQNRLANNEVFINQIGMGNQITSSSQTFESTSIYIQKGNYNDIFSHVNAQSFTSSVIQNGDGHKAFNFINSPGEDIGLELKQQGNNHHFEYFGSNSIGNKMKFRMEGSSRSLIVRNFK